MPITESSILVPKCPQKPSIPVNQSLSPLYKGALESAAGLKRDDVRDAVESALELYLFGPSEAQAERPCPSCSEGRLRLKLVRRDDQGETQRRSG